jgi:hypothetical protein
MNVTGVFLLSAGFAAGLCASSVCASLRQRSAVTAPDGTSQEVHYKPGQFRWAVSTPGVDLSSQSAHQEQNLSDERFEMIRIEPKRAR